MNQNDENYGENLGSEESRSIESEDLQQDEISDLFDHTAEVHSSDQRENPRALSMTRSEGVPILNILGRPLAGSQEKDADPAGSTIKRVGTERRESGSFGHRALPASRRTGPQGDFVRPFSRQDIESSDGTTLTGSLPFETYQPSGHGYETRVEGYGEPQWQDGPVFTQPAPTPIYSQPRPSDQDMDAKKVVLLKPSSPTDHLPKPTQNQGRMEFTWADTSAEEQPIESLREPDLQTEEEELDQQEMKLQCELEDLLARADGLSQKHTDFLMKKE